MIVKLTEAQYTLYKGSLKSRLKAVVSDALKRAKTREALERATLAMEYADRADTFSGAAGCVAELLGASDYSRKTEVGKQGENDLYINVGAHGHYPAERKTTGGRIEALRKPGAPKFVVYSMDFANHVKSKTSYWRLCLISPVVIPTEVFLAALDRFGATKSTGGSHPEEAIQPSNAKFQKWLEDWMIPFTPGKTYSWDDFEGLE